MKTSKLLLSCVLALGFSAVVHAGDLTSLVGLWKTQDVDGHDKFLVRVSQANGTYSSKIEKIIAGDPNEKCTLCPDDDARKNQPLLGMVMIQGLKKNGDVYEEGTGLAPAKGKIYKAEVKLIEGGKKAEMTAKVGFFSKTSTWVRIE